MSKNDSKRDSRPAGFAELKRKARAVRARPRRKDRGAGVTSLQVIDIHIDKQSDKNLDKKAPVIEAIPPVAPLEPPASWRASGQLEVLIYCRPLNPRLLLIRTDAGDNGRVAVKPELQRRFGTGTRIWVVPTPKPGFYELVGRYNQWGRRVLS